jgi:uncharacterized membrane protein
MEELFKTFARYVALFVEGAAALLIVIGAVEALIRVLPPTFTRQASLSVRKEVWVRFAMWLLLGLEFELAADIIRTAISPTWTDIGQLGAIAAIRTVLNYFLEKDIESYNASAGPTEVVPSGKAA